MAVNLMPLKILVSGQSHIGRVRQNNEDVWGQLRDENFIVLADGMGGHQAGEVAAREAVNQLCRHLKRKIQHYQDDHIPIEQVAQAIKESIQDINARIYGMGRELDGLRGMGTTLCCVWLQPEGVILGHVGDSRIYRLRHKKLKLMTKDHSLLRELMDMGHINEDQAGEFVYKNIITRAIGTEPSVEPTVEIHDQVAGDIYMLCSDGLTDQVSIHEMETILNKSRSIHQATKDLVSIANSKGGHDNVTVVLIKVQKTNESKDISRQ